MKLRLVALLLALPACAMASPFGILTGAAIGQVLQQQQQEAAGNAQPQLVATPSQDNGRAETQAGTRASAGSIRPVGNPAAAPEADGRQDASGPQPASTGERQRR